MTAADLGALREFLADPAGQPLSPLGQARCSVIGAPASCDVVDVVVLSRALALQPPGIAQTCAAALADTKTIGAAGGSFTFASGIALDVPAGALAGPTNVTITPLPCNQVEVVLAGEPVISHPKECLAAFLAEPSGLAFAAPVTVAVPQVPPAAPRAVPFQAIVDLAAATYSLEPTSIDYDAGTARFQIAHFSTHAIGELYQERQEWYRRCQSCDGYADPECFDADFPITLDQPACCQLKPALRAQCGFTPATCVCCREQRVRMTQSDLEVGGGSGCQLVTRDLESEFLDCAEPGPFVDTVGEVTEECPDDMTFATRITPDSGDLKSCQGIPLQATLSAFAPNGSPVILDQEFLPHWKVTPKSAGYMKGGPQTDGTLRGALVSGPRTLDVTAPLSRDEQIEARTTTGTASFQVTPLAGTSFAGALSGALTLCTDPEDNVSGSLDGTLLMSAHAGPSADIVLNAAGRPLLLSGALTDTGETCLFDAIGTYAWTQTSLSATQTIEGNAVVTGSLDEQLSFDLDVAAQDTAGDTCVLTGAALLAPGFTPLPGPVALPLASFHSVCLLEISSAPGPYPAQCADSGCVGPGCQVDYDFTGATESRVGPVVAPAFVPPSLADSLAARAPDSGVLLAAATTVVLTSELSNQQHGAGSQASVMLYLAIETLSPPPFTVPSVPVRIELIGEGQATGQVSAQSYYFYVVLDGDSESFLGAPLSVSLPGLSVELGREIFTTFSAGCGVQTATPQLGGVAGAACAVAMVPVLTLDQASFDSQYGSASFPLATHYRISYSANAPAD